MNTIKNKQKKKTQAKPLKPIQGKTSAFGGGKKGSVANIPKWSVAAVLAITALIYIRALYNGFIDSWDDARYIMENPFIKDFSFNGVKAIFSSFYASNYHPLTTLTYLFEYKLYGLNPFPYHLLNVLLHLFNTWLVYKFIEQLSGKKITALVVSVLFALHPMHVESVAWVSERKDVLYTMFFLLSMIAYLRYMKSGYQKKKYIGVILYFIASLLSKSAAVTLPVILIAIDLYKGRKINIRSLLEKAPLFLLSLLFGILAILSQKSDGALKDLSLSYTIINQIFIFSYNIAFYIVKLIAPLNLSTMYYYPVIHGNALPVLYYFSLPLLLIISWFIYRKISFRKESIFGVSFFLIALSVMLQIIPVGISFASDRYTYVASIGLFFIAGQWVSNIQKKHIKNAVVALFSIYTIMISYQTWARIGYWKNAEILFTDVIKKYPDNYHGYWVRGIYRNEINDLQGALQDFNKVMEYNPNRADNAIARGSIRYKLNDFKGAWEDADFTIKLDSTIAEAYNNRGIAYEGLGDMKSAFLDYNKAILLKPAYGMAYDNRGVIKAKSGDMVGAIEDINKAIKLSPEDSKAYSDRGNIKAMQKDYKGSVEDFNIALKLKPDDKIAYYNRGNSRYNLNDKTGACEDWKKSNELGYEMAADALSKFCN